MKYNKLMGMICAVVLAITAALHVPAYALDLNSTYYYEYYEPVDDLPKLKKDSVAYKTVKKFLYDIAKHTPYVSAITDCSGEATRALCYGLGGSNYYGNITLENSSTKAALYLDGTTVTYVGSYYNAIKNVADGTKMTLKAYDGTSATYTKYCIKDLPTALKTQADVDKLAKAFSYAKHAGAICFLYDGKGGHMWISLGQYPELSANNLASYLNNTYLAGTGAAIDPTAKTQPTSDRYEIYMHLGEWHYSWNIFRATSDNASLGMGINNVYTGSGFKDFYVLVPNGMEDTSVVKAPVKVEVKDSLSGQKVENAKLRLYEYDAFNQCYNEYDPDWYVDLVYSNGYYGMPSPFKLNGVEYKDSNVKITALNGGKFKLVKLDGDGYASEYSKEVTLGGSNLSGLSITGKSAVALKPLYGLRVRLTDPNENSLSGGKFTFTFDKVTYYGESDWNGSVFWYASEQDMNNGYPAIGYELGLSIGSNTKGILKQTAGVPGYRIDKSYAAGKEIDLAAGVESVSFLKVSDITVLSCDNSGVTIKRQDSFDGKLTTANVNYLLELDGDIYYGKTDAEGFVVWYKDAERKQILADTENDGRLLYTKSSKATQGVLTELGTEGYGSDESITITVCGTCEIIVDGDGVAAESAAGSIYRSL